jgi:hypothetical protein
MMPAVNAEYSAPDIHGFQPQASRKVATKIAAENCCKPTITSDIVDIIDIRCDIIEKDVKDDIISLLKSAKGPKKLPTLLLYDEQGLQIFEKVKMSSYISPISQFLQPQITYLDEYYLTNAEIDVLTKWGTEIAQNIQSGSMVVELGSGSVIACSSLFNL